MRRTITPTLTLALVISAGAAAAQPSRRPSASPETHYAIGNQLYTSGRFAEAAEEFELAYQRSRRGELLFNVARAWEDAGQLDRALDALQRFEAAGSPGYDRAVVGARLTDLRRRIAARNAAQQLAPPPPFDAAAQAPVAAVASPTRDFTLPIVLLATGGALMLGATPFWVSASGAYSDLEARCPMRQCASQADLDTRDSARTRAVIGDVLGGVGLATLVAGGVLLGITAARAAPSTTPQATAWCTSTGCGAGVVLRF